MKEADFRQIWLHKILTDILDINHKNEYTKEVLIVGHSTVNPFFIRQNLNFIQRAPNSLFEVQRYVIEVLCFRKLNNQIFFLIKFWK